MLVRDMESDFALAECLGDKGHCVLNPGCKLRSAFIEALDAFFSVLDAYTLQDIVSGRKRAKLLKILSLE